MRILLILSVLVATSYAVGVKFGGYNTSAGAQNAQFNGLVVQNSSSDLTTTHAASGMDYIYTTTLTGDIDGFGDATDTLSFDLRVKGYTGSSYDGADITLGTQYTLTYADLSDTSFSTSLADGESLQFSVENINFSSSNITSVDFTGFERVIFSANNGAYAYIGTTDAAISSATSGAEHSLRDTNTEVLTVTNLGDTDGFNVYNFPPLFEVNVIPEPSSLMLLGISAVALLQRRSRG